MTGPEWLDGGGHDWTGMQLRAWASALSSQIDEGRITVTVDIEKMQPGHQDWILHVVQSDPG